MLLQGAKDHNQSVDHVRIKKGSIDRESTFIKSLSKTQKLHNQSLGSITVATVGHGSFTQDSYRVPNYYSRPGPGQYKSSQEIAASSKHERATSYKFDKSGLGARSGIYQNLPKHRFTEFSKAQ